MPKHTVGVPFLSIWKEPVLRESEMIHAYRYEHDYSFKTTRELTLSEMEQIYYGIVRDPTIPTYTRIRYFECTSYGSSPARGKVILQFESLHPIPHWALALIVIGIISAVIAAAVIIGKPVLERAIQVTAISLGLLFVVGGLVIAGAIAYRIARG